MEKEIVGVFEKKYRKGTMTAAPLISIIVPVYNAEKYLNRCVDSITAQTFTDWECLLIDDGSTDKSPAICDEYTKRDSRIRVFHSKNGGVSAARNKGIRNAMGKWISFIDSDDYIMRKTALADYIERSSNCPNVGLLWCNHINMEKGIMYLSHFHYEKATYSMSDDIIRSLYKDGLLRYVTCWGKFFRMDIIRDGAISFPENINQFEDYCFVLDYIHTMLIYKRELMLEVTPFLVHECRADGNLSSHIKDWKKTRPIIREICVRLHKFGKNYELDKKVISELYRPCYTLMFSAMKVQMTYIRLKEMRKVFRRDFSHVAPLDISLRRKKWFFLNLPTWISWRIINVLYS